MVDILICDNASEHKQQQQHAAWPGRATAGEPPEIFYRLRQVFSLNVSFDNFIQSNVTTILVDDDLLKYRKRYEENLEIEERVEANFDAKQENKKNLVRKDTKFYFSYLG